MSRSGYTDDGENIGLWRGAVSAAINGRRGQALLKELAAALDAMPEKSLAANSLVTADGEYCTLGVLGAARGIDLTKLDPEAPEQVSHAFGIACAMAQEIVYLNDEIGDRWVERPWVKQSIWDHSPRYRVAETPQERWSRMRQWVADHIKAENTK